MPNSNYAVSANDDKNFYDWLLGDKDANAKRVRNSTSVEDFEAGTPNRKPKNQVVESFEDNPGSIPKWQKQKASEAEGRQITEQNVESSENWLAWRSKQKTTAIIGLAVIYYFFIK